LRTCCNSRLLWGEKNPDPSRNFFWKKVCDFDRLSGMKKFLWALYLFLALNVHGDLLALMEELRHAESSSKAADIARRVLIQSLDEDQIDEGLQALRSYLMDWVHPTQERADPDLIQDIISVTCCAVNLNTFKNCESSTEVWAWLFESDERVKILAETITDEDDVAAVSEIIQKLYEHDPNDRNRFFELMVALAVVWDTPRQEMHDQMGDGWLPPDEDICAYYDYFKKLYRSRKAKVRYDELSVDSLIFVVDVPAPVCELEWALAHVKERRGKWGSLYGEITYDHTRIRKGEYDWPHRDYSLQEIEDCHGICVDQAYYCVITARAHGIPSLYFHGRGKYGGHAWFGFLKSKNQWDLNIGRYSKGGYATGNAIHPQTDQEITDHELEYVCSRALRSVSHRDANAMVHLAGFFYEEGLTFDAAAWAERARNTELLCEKAWELEYDMLLEDHRIEKAIKLLKNKAFRFEKYPDRVAEIRQRQADLLCQMGEDSKAERMLRKEVRSVDRERDDLQQELVMAQAEQLLAQGESQKALRAIERVLEEQHDGGMKLIPLIRKYIEFAKKIDQHSHARLFLHSYED